MAQLRRVRARTKAALTRLRRLCCFSLDPERYPGAVLILFSLDYDLLGYARDIAAGHRTSGMALFWPFNRCDC